MTATMTSTGSVDASTTRRFRLHRAGILNVWQYDEQVFTFADGRMLLRGANGAGKSKTLELLLPFALDGDKARMTASAKHHTSLLWLMTDGVEGGNRVGYVWVEFARTTETGQAEFFTCGVGVRASSTARQATAWHFVTSGRVGVDLSLEDAAGPLPQARLREVLGAEQVFERAADYKAHVGQALFGLDPRQYDEVLRLLYWLRQPQVGEDIEPARLTQQLSQALPQLDEQAVRGAADTFDGLTAVGEKLDRRAAAAVALSALAQGYAAYAGAVVADRARAVGSVVVEERQLRTALDHARETLGAIEQRRAETLDSVETAQAGAEHDRARLRALEDSSEFRDQRRLDELGQRAQRETELAGQATAQLARSRGTVDRATASLAEQRDRLQESVELVVAAVRSVGDQLRRSVPGAHVSTTLTSDTLLSVPDEAGPVMLGALDRLRDALAHATSAVSHRRAGVGLVRQSLEALSSAQGRQTVAEREAEQTEVRWEEAREARVEAEATSRREHDALLARLAGWAARPAAPEVVLPAELTPETLPDLDRLGHRSAAPQLASLRDGLAEARAGSAAARTELERLRADRAMVEAERAPAPPAPALPRTARPDGHALWQLVDFTENLPQEDRAGLEGALQASGLLDAWVRPGGRLLDAEQRDVVLVPVGTDLTRGPRPQGGLDGLLVVDLPEGSDLTIDDVTRVLRSIGLGPGSDRRPGGGATAWVATDGSWRLGPAHGRAGKDRAQYVGATARVQERARRLAVLDADIETQREVRDRADLEQTRLAEQVTELEAWAATVPSGRALSTAWDRVGLFVEAEQREERRNQRAQAEAQAARSESVRRGDELRRVADEQALPIDPTALAAVEEQLRAVTEGLRELDREDPRTRRMLESWERAWADHAAARHAHALDEDAAAETARAAHVATAEFTELQASVGDSVAQLRRRIADTRASLKTHQRDGEAARSDLDSLHVEFGKAQTGVAAAEERLVGHRSTRTSVLDAFTGLARVPGLFEAADVQPQDADNVLGLEGLDPAVPLPRRALAVVRTLSALSTADVPSATTQLWERYTAATSGPAAEHQPVLASRGELHTVSGRDEAGEAVITTLSKRVAAAVERDRELLTQREREQFERHVLGELGDALRRCRRDARELVDAMNLQLGEVSTSQGIRVRLDWRLRDDVASEARAAVDLLTQPVGALLPEERAALRDALHRLIEASRAEHPELSYSEHLAAALDYRTWFTFTIRYTRPEAAGRWERLHRRSPLSQGEQKVLCYLPLFAAAAAHFTSLAGAAPYAPRLVLLDDAFPKIDVRTHPLLFGLLVQLDLDFVITSERLWGDHSTVPSLAIYEALRDPGQRGIAQYEYRWDGRTLESVG
ncbi:TIGR02680 family protein [Ornithinimicrobium sediminis]|uniref:TIGR02680 family protein n=1 Tax=Ornithinimicrobium sediminis TaxID=2904603 RepID=UPI001E5821D3|nr:TIGR02680 family protein [Ornithinimicrobium sediminis]MCE0487962.1 TIGR02680 family protein [Ornithinimicrobium sediminis]